MSIQKRQTKEVKRIFRKPELVNYEAVERYVELYGTPVCFCCGFITLAPLFRLYSRGWRVYCINCGITLDVIGHCQHDPDEDMSKRMINPQNILKKLLDKQK